MNSNAVYRSVATAFTNKWTVSNNNIFYSESFINRIVIVIMCTIIIELELRYNGYGSHAHTVVWECCKDDQQSQWEMPNFGVCQHRNPWVDFQKNLHSWLCCGHHPTCKYWGHSVQRACVCSCVKLSPSGVYFFLFFKGSCASLQVGPLNRSSPQTAQMTRPCRVHVLFMVSSIKIISAQKCEKLHYTLWEIWTAITLASLKICTSC